MGLSKEETIRAGQIVIVQQFLDRVVEHIEAGSFLESLRLKVEALSYDEDGKSTLTFRVATKQPMANTYGIVHGGFIASIIDVCTSYGCCGELLYWNEDRTEFDAKRCSSEFGVSRNINVQYIKAMPIGVDVLVECTVRSNSKRYTYLTCNIRDAKTRTLYVVGSHDKVKLYAKL